MEAELKAVDHQQMAEHGTAGLSQRGIAREMSITAPATYNYFPRLEDLITALIVDACTRLSAHLRQSDPRLPCAGGDHPPAGAAAVPGSVSRVPAP